ncbi:helix-turn-helix transcriptional regulator [Streptomyces sp. NBC_01239]|uniref:helix-turn-helix domain-containing protein n=1 Tax=Streptomyces sp. NBC_01239 TaxID=2903792 RepID=UPI00224E57A0|nr:helix-turn-helix transcriptional regulator [Streptomyces sp. NBC_01239]MCX4817785.1 helix-turn-helix transcriptional regulator [Streptomyces sp. NBC_01239]
MNRPPFSPDIARSARKDLGLSPHQVTEQMNVYGVVVDIPLVHAWEAGEYRPTEEELFALADVLWCRAKDLMGIESPRTLTEHRLVRQFSTERLARSIGMDTAQYERAEETDSWSGDGQQTSALLRVLDLTLLQLTQATGQPVAPQPAIPRQSRPTWSRDRSR